MRCGWQLINKISSTGDRGTGELGTSPPIARRPQPAQLDFGRMVLRAIGDTI